MDSANVASHSRATAVLTTLALVLLPPVLLLSLRKLMVAYRERTEVDAMRSVRWATIALALTSLVALGELGSIALERSRDLPHARALWEGLCAAKNLCAPPLGVSGALVYLSRMMLTATRRTPG